MSQTAEVDASSTNAPTPAPRRWNIVLIGVAVLLVAALVILVLQQRRIDDLENDKVTRRDIGTAATAFAQALLTYDYQDLTAAKDLIAQLSTERFAKEYAGFFTGGVDVAITKLQATSKATLHDVYIREVSGDRAHAIVTLDSEVRSTAGTRYTTSTYLDLELVKQEGRWKVDNVISVGALDQRTVAPDGSVTSGGATTTTAPVPTPETSTSSSSGG